MKKILFNIPLFLLLLSIVTIHNGCKQDDEVVTPPVDENVDKEVTSVRNYSTVVKLLTDANAFAWSSGNNITPSTGGCPSLGIDSTSVPRVLVVRYNNCVSSDGIKRRGAYTLAYTMNPARDSLYSEMSFENFSIFKTSDAGDTSSVRVTGGLHFSTKMLSSTSYRFHSGGEVLLQTNDGTTKDVTVTSLDGTANFNSLSSITDDTYLLSGSGSVQDNGYHVTANISLSSSSPLQILSSCKYPVSGIATFSINGSGVQCDFSPNSNACDAIVKMIKGSFSKTVDLSTINF